MSLACLKWKSGRFGLEAIYGFAQGIYGLCPVPSGCRGRQPLRKNRGRSPAKSLPRARGRCPSAHTGADEVPAQRIMDSIGSGQVGRGIIPLPHFNDPSCPLLSVFNIKIPVSTKRFYRLIFIRDRLFFTIEQKQFCIQSAMLIIYLTNEGACLTFKPV